MAETKELQTNSQPSPAKKKGMSFALSAFIVGLGLIITKCSGLLRDIIVSMRFSEDLFRDGFTLAFTIPDLFYNLLVGGAIYSTVAPYMSAQLAVGKEKQGIRTVSIFISCVCVVMVVCCAIGTIFSEPIYALYALRTKNIDPEVLSLAAQASKMLFPQIFFIMLAALCNGILNSYRKFAITSFGPVLYNILVLLAIYFFGGNSLNKLVMTTGGILVSSIIYFVFQYSLGFKQMKSFRFNFKPADRDFLMLFKRAVPILISASITQINVVVLNGFALMFDQGSVYGFRNASTIWQIPYSVFVVAITTVMTPELAGDYESKRYEKASDLISHSMRSALFMTIPSAVFIAIMNLDVVKAIYQWTSAYTDRNAQTAATFLLGFCSAIVTATVIHVFNQAFYAIGNTIVPLVSGIIGLAVNYGACWMFVALGIGPLSLSLAYSFTNICQMVILTLIYCKRKELAPHGILKFLIKSALCVAVMGGAVFVLDHFVPAQGGKIIQLLIIAMKGVVAVVVYFAMAIILRMEEATEWINRYKAKIFKKKSANKKAS